MLGETDVRSIDACAARDRRPVVRGAHPGRRKRRGNAWRHRREDSDQPRETAGRLVEADFRPPAADPGGRRQMHDRVGFQRDRPWPECPGDGSMPRGIFSVAWTVANLASPRSCLSAA
jgi:hypothetical protein